MVRKKIAGVGHFQVVDRSIDGETELRKWDMTYALCLLSETGPVPEPRPEVAGVEVPPTFHRVVRGSIGNKRVERVIVMPLPEGSKLQMMGDYVQATMDAFDDPMELPSEHQSCSRHVPPPQAKESAKTKPGVPPLKRTRSSNNAPQPERKQKAKDYNKKSPSKRQAPSQPTAQPRSKKVKTTTKLKSAATKSGVDVSATFAKPLIPPEHMEKYKIILARPVIPSQFMDMDVLKITRIEENVLNYFKNMGWPRFQEMRFPTYEKLTRAFLATFVFHKDGINSRFQFSLGGKQFELSLIEVHKALLFDGAATTEPELPYDEKAFWRKISDDDKEFYSQKTRRKTIRDPALVLVHEYLCRTALGRGSDNPGVHNTDLRFLYSCVTKKPLKLGYWLGVVLGEQASKGSKGNIRFGGIITAIAQTYCGFPKNPNGIDKCEGTLVIEERTLSNMNYIRRIISRGRYVSIPEFNKIKEEKAKANTEKTTTKEATEEDDLIWLLPVQ
ncbi:unnamed protein product [Linum trigynum]|uniref:Arabidopsis retrotransposon Orf1 C-terminal domain-containing protein n=1 Tax=Linum trigynum TaxID=586398 RepID=A0AAV2G8N3_9ROSI